ncbi:MAG: bifunctional enzyme IspD/IspF [Candidatus Reconcilbacillus cellulovorans]|uniref:Bifunctional enzyme IspD/IspF n=1 Tax=Candidatus Reconcilbacillus cellulovorans TaxID=1906605 RepID=A0A2A6E2Z3_9BACL|nr:MAG: bifunctional enzyme IspD/IspF [Candidatus Reconcilbacillus cellulovorans]
MAGRREGFHALIVAAGSGTRMKTAERKQFLLLCGKPVVVYALERFDSMPETLSIVLVVAPGDEERARKIAEQYGIAKLRAVVAGGQTRQQSVSAGLRALIESGAGGEDYVLVHDGVRPFFGTEDALRCLRAAQTAGAAVLAVPVKDTVKQVDENMRIVQTPDRRSLWAAQTPQAFRVADLLRAHEEAERLGFLGTDDAELAERAGVPVAVVEGRYDNIKITTPEDWCLAERLAGGAVADALDRFRVGFGFDVHPLAEGRPCVIGGVRLPHSKGPVGHSDADVLLHAVCDAVLGALGLGDIGKHFPDTDPAYCGADSLELLRRCRAFAEERGYRVGNVDATLLAERPKIAPHVPSMVQRIADALGTEPARVNIKATTTERLGFVGREEGIAAQAVVMLVRSVV